jgi:hypothetical protein
MKTNKELHDIAWRLIDRGSFELNSDKEFSELTRSEQITVRRHVRFELLMNE